MRRVVRLPVIQDTSHRANEISKAASKQRREKRARRHSPEVERDSRIEVEPLPYDAADGPACGVAAYRRYVRWRAAHALVGTAPDPMATPATRADCPANRHECGCGAYRCRAHLWRREEPPGRPGLANVPRGDRGRTIAALGDMGPDPAPDLEPAWLRPGRMPASCALDVADMGPRTNTEVGAALARHRTLVARAIKQAINAAKARGVTFDDLLDIAEPDRPHEYVSRVAARPVAMRRTQIRRGR